MSKADVKGEGDRQVEKGSCNLCVCTCVCVLCVLRSIAYVGVFVYARGCQCVIEWLYLQRDS